MDVAKYIDVSAVRANCSQADVQKTWDVAVQYGCLAVFALPCFTSLLQELREKADSHSPKILLGGTVGFPCGGETSSMKVQQAKELLALGCDEIDMVINVGFVKSGLFARAEDDVAAVRQAIGNYPLKVILECHYLTDEEICRASELAVRAGTNWVKTSTGWTPTGATLENVALIKKTVGAFAKVKAAGGVKDLATIYQMINLGVERFGIGAGTAVAVLEESAKK
ncbi:MAG: deoxyribose-phosphate aldolase [Planctomycetaceae bacterium]|jgi:deoxyribose-phosphate aldolase|nr:deoxyribose-phosphate aldolase [Planctomycetaceae bacterium]